MSKSAGTVVPHNEKLVSFHILLNLEFIGAYTFGKLIKLAYQTLFDIVHHCDPFIEIVDVGYLIVLVILSHHAKRLGFHPEVNVFGYQDYSFILIGITDIISNREYPVIRGSFRK